MSGWLLFAGLAALALLALAALRLPRRLWTATLAAVALAAAGYAWQGSPGLDGHPVTEEAKAGAVDLAMADLRRQMFGRFDADDAWFTMADAQTRAGSSKEAAMVMLMAVKKSPDDATLWTGLGLKLAEQDHGMITPASEFAFKRAMQLAPRHPGPPFFYGLALTQAHRLTDAQPLWAQALALTPAQASYRPVLLVFNKLLAIQVARAPQ